MRRKDLTKNSIILKRKIISDNKLSFLFLINKINYKKLKSIAKRPLLPHYVLYKFFLKSLKINFIKTWHRNFTQLNRNLSFFVPGVLIEKRMFYKNVKFVTSFDESIHNSYSWYNTKIKTTLNKNVYFNKIHSYPSIGGKTILITPNKEEIPGIFKKDFLKKMNADFNYYIYFNIVLLNILEIYKVLTTLWIYKILN